MDSAQQADTLLRSGQWRCYDRRQLSPFSVSLLPVVQMLKACFKCYSDITLPYCMNCLLLKQCAKMDLGCQMSKVSHSLEGGALEQERKGGWRQLRTG